MLFLQSDRVGFRTGEAPSPPGIDGRNGNKPEEASNLVLSYQGDRRNSWCGCFRARWGEGEKTAHDGMKRILNKDAFSADREVKFSPVRREMGLFSG